MERNRLLHNEDWLEFEVLNSSLKEASSGVNLENISINVIKQLKIFLDKNRFFAK